MRSFMTTVYSFILVTMAMTSFAVAAADDRRSTFNSGRVPVIDLASWTRLSSSSSSSSTSMLSLSKEQIDVVDQVRDACENIGFFMITNHGFDQDVMDDAFQASQRFFDQPAAEKLKHKTWNEVEYPYGYEQSESLVKGRQLDDDDGGGDDGDDKMTASSELPAMKDLKETYSIGPSNPSSGMPQRWYYNSTTTADFRKSIELYYEHMEDVAMTLLEIFAVALDESPIFFVDKMNKHMSALRLVHYYPLEDPKYSQHVVRAGAHTDYGALTILAARDVGLEVLLRSNNSSSGSSHNGRRARGQWFPVPIIRNTLIINLGDLMQRWTNDKWVSTLHRVAMPSTDALEERYSIAFFVNVNGDTLIEPLRSCRDGDSDDNHKYSIITAGEHLMAKHLASMSADDSVAKERKAVLHNEL